MLNFKNWKLAFRGSVFKKLNRQFYDGFYTFHVGQSSFLEALFQKTFTDD